jgi:thiol-disulfide isomerase/thioredoxin
MNPSYVANKEFTSQGEQDGGDSDVADLYLFYTTWCPHCKTTKPIWEKLKNKVGNSGVKGVKINFIEIDCDKDKDTANKFKVEGYPTIKMVHNNQVIEYDAKPNLETLMQFLETSL